jgi:hypothetical protein
LEKILFSNPLIFWGDYLLTDVRRPVGKPTPLYEGTDIPERGDQVLVWSFLHRVTPFPYTSVCDVSWHQVDYSLYPKAI